MRELPHQFQLTTLEVQLIYAALLQAAAQHDGHVAEFQARFGLDNEDARALARMKRSVAAQILQQATLFGLKLVDPTAGPGSADVAPMGGGS